MFDAASTAYELAIKDLPNGKVTDIEIIYRWSRRCMDAQTAVSTTRRERAAAVEAHLKRMTELETAAPNMAKLDLGNGRRFPTYTLPAATYYRLEAQSLLAEARR